MKENDLTKVIHARDIQKQAGEIFMRNRKQDVWGRETPLPFAIYSFFKMLDFQSMQDQYKLQVLLMKNDLTTISLKLALNTSYDSIHYKPKHVCLSDSIT